ncbi:unnamed protein product [marine sediment metagenome]|uniref:Uncharacterized protein n=1 Tax=marine sediment metagenome TaxID=412755 RepID=X0X1P4_9ZZZZ
MAYDHSKFMKNWWKARLCHGCKSLHVGRKVDHNHCDLAPSDDLKQDRVNGREQHKCWSFEEKI